MPGPLVGLLPSPRPTQIICVCWEAFVLSSTEKGLVHKYEQLGIEDLNANVIRAQVSQLLCEAGNRVLVELAQSLKERKLDAAGKLAGIAANLFEPAISLTKDQIGGYNGMAALYALAGKRAKSHDYAKRGLAVLEEMRDPASQAMRQSIIFSSSDTSIKRNAYCAVTSNIDHHGPSISIAMS
jgi:hypothetical protein